MKIYPKPQPLDNSRGFSEEEIKNGYIYLYADVECVDCGKIQSVPMAGSIDNGKCFKCGGITV